MICAAHYSLEAAVRMIKPGSSVCGFRLGVRMCVCEVMLLDSPSRAQRTHTTLDHRRTPFYAARMVQLSLHWRRFNGELLSIRFLCFLHMSDSTSPRFCAVLILWFFHVCVNTTANTSRLFLFPLTTTQSFAVTQAIEQIAGAFGCTPVQGVVSSSVAPYRLDGPRVVACNSNGVCVRARPCVCVYV